MNRSQKGAHRTPLFSNLLFVALAFSAQAAGAKCSDYIGFWIADYDKADHRDYMEFHFDANLNREMRESYYRKTGEPDSTYGQDYGRLKDSIGRCFGIIDTARQVDSKMAPSGHVHFGEWFAFDFAIKNIDGRKMIYEVTADTLESGNGQLVIAYDTLKIEYVAASPVFLNKFIFPKPSASIKGYPRRKSEAGAMVGYRIDGKKAGTGSGFSKEWRAFKRYKSSKS
jgi:hypothetical protein